MPAVGPVAGVEVGSAGLEAVEAEPASTLLEAAVVAKVGCLGNHRVGPEVGGRRPKSGMFCSIHAIQHTEKNEKEKLKEKEALTG